jgi:carbonic anhydrase
MAKKWIGICAAAVLALGACSQAEEKAASASHGGAAPHWTYEEAAEWGELSPAFAACGAGERQSPIDLTAASSITSNEVTFDYQPGPVEILNNGHTIQVNIPEGSRATIGGEVYNLLQFHFHAPSEHAVDGRREVLEAHFVHKNAAGGLAVFGVLMQEGVVNETLAPLWAAMPETAGSPTPIADLVFDPKPLLPTAERFTSYDGSLTTPPCSEGVRWFVFREFGGVGAEQVRRFLDVVHENARPLQPRNERAVGVVRG